jgi:hypothetical protein
MSLSWTNPDEDPCSRHFFSEAAWRTDKGKQIIHN